MFCTITSTLRKYCLMILSCDFNKNMYCLLQYIKRVLLENKVSVCLYTTLLTPSLLNPLTCSQDLFLSLTATDISVLYCFPPILSESFSDWFAAFWLEYSNKYMVKECMNLWEVLENWVLFGRGLSQKLWTPPFPFSFSTVCHPFSALNIKEMYDNTRTFLSTKICMPVIVLRPKGMSMTTGIHDLKESIA